MFKHLAATALLAVSLPALLPAACPAGKTGANVLDGVTKVAFILSAESGIARITFLPGGFLQAVLTLNDGAQVYRQAPASGRWMFRPDCTDGMIWINFGRKNFTFNFLEVTPFLEIFTNNPPGIYGTSRPQNDPRLMYMEPPPVASRTGVNQDGDSAFISFGPDPAPPASCPTSVGGNPLRIIENTIWNYFTTEEFQIANANTINLGVFIATLPNPMAGTLTVGRKLRALDQIPFPPDDDTVRLRHMAFPQQLLLQDNYITQGRYIINPDCTGGEILFMLNGYARQFEFLFTNSLRNEMIWISDVPEIQVLGTAARAF